MELFEQHLEQLNISRENEHKIPRVIVRYHEERNSFRDICVQEMDLDLDIRIEDEEQGDQSITFVNGLLSFMFPNEENTQSLRLTIIRERSEKEEEG